MRISILTPHKAGESQHVLHGVQHRAGQAYNVEALVKDCIFIASKDFRYHDELWIQIMVESEEEKASYILRDQIHTLLDKFKKAGEWWGYPVLRTIDLIVL
jgi:hypothetical protein